LRSRVLDDQRVDAGTFSENKRLHHSRVLVSALCQPTTLAENLHRKPGRTGAPTRHVENATRALVDEKLEVVTTGDRQDWRRYIERHCRRSGRNALRTLRLSGETSTVLLDVQKT